MQKSADLLFEPEWQYCTRSDDATAKNWSAMPRRSSMGCRIVVIITVKQCVRCAPMA